MKLLIALLLSVAMFMVSMVGAQEAKAPARMFTIDGQVSYVRKDAIGLEDVELRLADNVSVVAKNGRPASLKHVTKGAKVELLVMRGGIVQEIRLK